MTNKSQKQESTAARYRRILAGDYHGIIVFGGPTLPDNRQQRQRAHPPTTPPPGEKPWHARIT